MVIAHDRYAAFVLDVDDPLAQEAIRNTWFAVPLMDSISEEINLSESSICSLIGLASWFYRADILRPPHLYIFSKQDPVGLDFDGRPRVFILWVSREADQTNNS